MKLVALIVLLALSGCACKDYGYCPHIFPKAE